MPFGDRRVYFALTGSRSSQRTPNFLFIMILFKKSCNIDGKGSPSNSVIRRASADDCTADVLQAEGKVLLSDIVSNGSKNMQELGSL